MMQTDAVHQMSSLYNYSRSQKEAEREREKAGRARVVTILIIVSSVFLLGGIILFYFYNQKKRQKRINKLERALEDVKSAREEVLEELGKLKARDYESVIAIKEKKEKELTLRIAELQGRNRAIALKDDLDSFINSKIVEIFMKKAESKSQRPIPTESEWKLLISCFSKEMPACFESFSRDKVLSVLEQRICILLLLDFPGPIINRMTETSSQVVSQAKARANEKIFGKKDAHPLKNNLLHSLRRN